MLTREDFAKHSSKKEFQAILKSKLEPERYDEILYNVQYEKELESIAASRNCKAGQIALAWLNARGDDIFPIPGTKRRTYLKENIASLQIKLTTDELNRIDCLLQRVKGNRKNDAGMKLVDRSQG